MTSHHYVIEEVVTQIYGIHAPVDYHTVRQGYESSNLTGI